MAALTIPCSKCHGKGHTAFPAHLIEALACFPKFGSRTAYDIALRLNIEHSAACNRLADLHKNGLVSRVRDGKTWNYARKQPTRDK